MIIMIIDIVSYYNLSFFSLSLSLPFNVIYLAIISLFLFLNILLVTFMIYTHKKSHQFSNFLAFDLPGKILDKQILDIQKDRGVELTPVVLR